MSLLNLTESQWLQSALLAGVVLFVTGLYLVLTKRNVLMVLMGIELMLNAANINFVVFSKYYPGAEGILMTLFVLIIAAAEAAVGLAIILGVWRDKRTTMIDEVG
jgi:NADH-quinone oxidoreductase subunit K